MSKFLPKGYVAPAGSNSFMKFEEGENRFRIMSPEAVIGWEGWVDGKPFRREGIEKNIEDNEVDTDNKFGKDKPKIDHFWAFVVWDYADDSLKILEIKQKTIMAKIQAHAEDEDWGDPTGYDISVTRETKGTRTSYDVKMYPPKKVSKEMETAYKETELDPRSLFAEPEDDSSSKKAASKKFAKF